MMGCIENPNTHTHTHAYTHIHTHNTNTTTHYQHNSAKAVLGDDLTKRGKSAIVVTSNNTEDSDMTFTEYKQSTEAQQIKERCAYIGYKPKEIEKILLEYYHLTNGGRFAIVGTSNNTERTQQ